LKLKLIAGDSVKLADFSEMVFTQSNQYTKPVFKNHVPNKAALFLPFALVG
jgi:hypothetical protein